MNTRKSQWLPRFAVLFLCLSLSTSVLVPMGYAQEVDTYQKPNENINKVTDPKERENAFNEAVSSFSEEDARLGNELATLPGPNVSFNDLLQTIIFWSASLASSVALLLVMLASFKAIGGSEEAHNNQKRTWIQVFVGIALILFSFQIVAVIMGILWAT